MSTPTSTKRTLELETESEGSPRPASPSTGLPTTKSLRLTRAEKPSLFCSLPPTCHPPHNQPTALANALELESHYAKFHAHVCEDRGCAAVFPNSKLLELHQTECHDPIALLRKERGEKIFACHLESCTRKFSAPKNRRLHLIQAHGFPKEYFFAVTNKGVGGLLKKWGEGASMIRGTWTARDIKEDGNEDVESFNAENSDDGGDSIDEEMLSTGTAKNSAVIPSSTHSHQAKKESVKSDTIDPGLDDLASSMGSLSLVPRSIRFGRGGKGARMVRDTKKIDRGAKKEHNPAHGLLNGSTPDEHISQMDAEDGLQLSDHDVSINIDAALEAFKSEARSNDAPKSILGGGAASGSQVPNLGRRGRGGGRGRGSSRGRGHGRS